MNFRTDFASPRYPEYHINALVNTIDYAETESRADWLLQNMANAAPYAVSPPFARSYETATSDIGRFIFLKLQDLGGGSTTMPFFMHIVPQDYATLVEEHDLLPGLTSWGIVRGDCKKPRHLEFTAELFDF